MKKNIKRPLSQAVGALTLLTLAAAPAFAREPGVLPTVPQGATMGVPIAAPSPFDGIFLSSRTGISSLDVYDDSGNEAPTSLKLKDTVFQLAFVPGNKLLGGQYRAFLSVPFVSVDVKNAVTPFGLANAKSSGIAGVEIRPLDISWETSPGIFASAGASLFTPGKWSATSLANPGGDFMVFSPTAGFSYMRDGWNASAHLMYFSNQKNRTNQYKSGDEAHLNLTAMKDVGSGLSLGVVGSVRQQVSDDKNPNGAYGGFVADRAKSKSLGLSVTKQLGPVNLNLMYTKDMSVRNTAGGNRLWLNLIVPLQVKGM